MKHRTSEPTTQPRRSMLAEQIQKICLGSMIVVVPLTTAWAKESGVVILFLTSLVLVFSGLVRIHSDGCGFIGSLIPAYIAAAACILVGVQLVPLPSFLLNMISPIQETLFADWAQLKSAFSTPERWQTISLAPHLTKSCLFLVVAYSQMVVGMLLFLERSEDVKWLLRLVAVSTVIMASVGLAQLLFGNGKFLWFFENPMRSALWPAKGTFTNQNHFAGFLALGFGPCLMQIFETQEGRNSKFSFKSGFGKSTGIGDTRIQLNKIWAALTVVVLLAALLSFSRGGLAAVLVAVTISSLAYRNELVVLARFMLPAIIFCLLGLLAFGAETLSERWHLLVTSSSLEEISAPRIALWQSLVKASPSFALAGAGAGTHAEIYPLWMQEDFGKRFSHAENGYLQLLIETGVPGVLLLLLSLIVLARVAVPAFRTANKSTHRILLVCFAGVIASLVHSLADFVWYMPACLIITISLLLLIFRMSEIQHNASLPQAGQSSRRIPAMAFSIVVVVAGAGLFMGLPQGLADARSEQHWLAFRGLAIEESKPGFDEELRDDQLKQMILSLEACLIQDPEDYRAMSELAVLYLRRFEASQAESSNPMTLSEIRSTVESVKFESPRAMLQWMVTAFGDGVGDLLRSALTARKAVSGQPLRATPYLALHQLAFLMTEREDVEQLLMEQVLRVRPYDASIRYAAGVLDLEAGRRDLGFERLAYAFRKDKKLRIVILQQMADVLSSNQLIEVLDPDLEALTQIFQFFKLRGELNDLPSIAAKFRADFKNGMHQDQAHYWSAVASVFKYLDDHPAEILALKKAVLLNPQSYSVRRALALRTAQVGNASEAIAALKGCLIRNPEDGIVKRRLAEIRLDFTKISAGLTN